MVHIHMARIAYTLKSLRWIPHVPTSEPKQVRFDLRLQLLSKLRTHTHDNWRDLGTGDKNWFYYEYVRERRWTAQNKRMPEGENGTITSTKIMLTLLWNPHDFHVVTMLPPAESFSASWFRDQSLVPFVQSFFPSGWSPKQKT
jgi:hypothetical protein